MTPFESLFSQLLWVLAILLLLVVLKEIISEKIYYRFFYNKKTSEQNRPTPTRQASKLAEVLSGKGYHAELEKWDGYKHIDIAIVQAKVNIEVDGSQHNYKANVALRDLERTYYSLEKGFITLRIPNSLIKWKFTQTVDYIEKILKIRMNKL
jgi:very-short-patch-repair endonuclease